MKIKEILETEHDFLSEPDDLPEEVVYKYEDMAKQERKNGGDVQIDPEGAGAIYLIRSDGVEFNFEGMDADDVLANIPANINPDHFLLARSRFWKEGQFDNGVDRI